jgi:CelD/BcsL family acetyltransferase involved in cellulose biosynthesis
MSSLTFFHAAVAELPFARPRPARTNALPAETPFTEIVDLDTLIALRPAWADLVARALEPNVFLEPGFAIPLFQHCRRKRKLSFLLAWAEKGPNPRHELLGLLPLALPGGVFRFFAQGAEHEHAPLGTPLFDRDRGAEALRQMIGWLRQNHPRLTGLRLAHLPKEGPTFAMLSLHAEAKREHLYLFNEYERAALSRTVDAAEQAPNFISAKRRKQYRQQRRRMGENGEVTYRSTRDPAAIRQAAESFLLLEFKGWKGARKTALLADSSGATFFRSMTRSMAAEGKCRIDSLDIDGTPVAMGVVIESGDRAHYWKTTYDERFASVSPGVQLTLELTQTQLARPIALTDSCAIANHPMIDHIWKDRIAMADVLLPLGHAEGLPFAIGLWREIARQRVRGTVKPFLKGLLRRRH